VLSELRETQRQINLSPLYDPTMVNGRSNSPPSLRNANLLSAHTVHTCAEFFFADVYPSQPILCREQLHDYTMALDTSPEAYCFLAAFCAAMLLQPWMKTGFNPAVESPSGSMSLQTGSALLEEALRVHRYLNYAENPSVTSITISYFIFASASCLDRQCLAWHHLRSATSQAIELGLDSEETYDGLDFNTLTSRRNLFWLLFLSER
jgi:hypothetical protein